MMQRRGRWDLVGAASSRDQIAPRWRYWRHFCVRVSLVIIFVSPIFAGEVTWDRLLMTRALRAEAGEKAPPFDLKEEAAIKEGAALFSRSCSLAYCHGKEGRAGAAPRLRGREFEPDFLYSLISDGAGEHLPFKDRYSPEQLWKIIAYILSLSEAKE